MANRLFTFSSFGSLIAACLIVVAWMFGDGIDARTQHLSIVPGVNVSLSAYSRDARLHIFNHSMPYCGGIVWFAEPERCRRSYPALRVLGFGDTCGVYFRMSPPPPGDPDWWWTVSLSLAYPLVLTLILPAIWLRQRLRNNDRRRGFPVEACSARIFSEKIPEST